MKKTYKNIIKFFLLFSLIFSCFSITAFAESSFATISSCKGSVSVKKSGGEKKISAFKGMRLKKGDTIITGKKSSATLDIDSNKEVTVGDNTQLSITELSKEIAKNSSKSSFTLQAGKVWANVKTKLNKDSKFQIKTSTTIAGVRGTKFYVSQEEGQSEIAVLEGTVISEIYIPTSKPDGAPNIEKVEHVIEKGQQLTVDDTVQNVNDIIQQPVQLENLNTFVLESYKDSITEPDKELLDKLDKIIEEKKVEEDKKEKDKPNTENGPKSPPQISYDPVVAPEAPANNDTGYTPPPDSIPNSAPTAINLYISGDPKVGNTLSGMYTYSDMDNDIEGTSTFKWYRGTSVNGLDKTVIEGATALGYTLTSADLDKYIFFEVTPTAATGVLKGESFSYVLDTKISSSDNTPPVGTFLNIYSPSVSTLFIQFNEALNADTISITDPSTLILNSTVKVTNTEFTENVNIKEVQWNYTGSMTNSPILAINLDIPIFIYSQVGIQVQFNQDIVKDIYGNISNNIVYGQLINNGSTNILELSENTINSNGATLSIKLSAEQGNWVEDIVSDTSKLNKLYDSFYTDSNNDQWSKLKDRFTATYVNSTTIDINIPAEPNYNIDKDQYVILVIPGELLSSSLTVPSTPIVIHAQPAGELTLGTEYSCPVPGTGGSSYGTTKIEMLNKDSIPEATKWQIKVYDYSMGYYYDENIAYDSIIEGAIDYTLGADIKALPYQNLLLLATDYDGKVKKFALIYLMPEMVSIPIPPIENFSFDNSDLETKGVVIQGNELSDYYATLEVMTSNSVTISDASPAEYELYQLDEGIHKLTSLQDATTTYGDTVYYRFVDGQLKSPWVADGIVTYDEVKPKNSNSENDCIRFILSGSEKKVKINGIPGICVAVIKNGIMLTPVSLAANGYTDISIDNISPNDPIFLAILNESGNIAAKSDEVYLPDKMYNNISFKKFTVLGHSQNIYIKSNYTGYINLFKNETLSTSFSIVKSNDTYIPISNGLANGDKIQVQLVDELGNESELSDEVIVMDAPNVSNIQLNFGTAEVQDSITISNLEPYKYYKITIVNASSNEINYELDLQPSAVTGTAPLTFNLGSSINGTAGSTYKIYFSDFCGNTSPMSEIITAR